MRLGKMSVANDVSVPQVNKLWSTSNHWRDSRVWCLGACLVAASDIRLSR